MTDVPSETKPVDQPTDQPKTETPAPSAAQASQPSEAPSTNGSAGDTPPTAEPTPQNVPVAAPVSNKPSSKKILFIIGALLVLGLSALFAYFLTAGTQVKTNVTNTTESTGIVQPTLAPQKDTSKTDINNPQAFSKLLVYGAWSGQTSLIKAVELSTNTTTVLATLPSSIKKVSVLSAETILYIDQTDKRDHGKQLVIYNIKTKAPQGNIAAAQGYGIDDYVLSPDKKFLAIWEVAFAPNAEILQGGKSRVYAVDLSRPTVKKLLYDETAGPTAPVHYPRAILNNGRVFADKFLPNDPKGGAGWAYGLSVVDFDGTNRQDLTSMAAGTYGTQPTLSADGKHLLFSGYDGSKGDGNTLKDGYRLAVLAPNTVEVLDTETFTRAKLPNLDNKNIYSSSAWDISTGKIILTIISPETKTTGVYAYDTNVKQIVKLATPSTENVTYGFLTEVTDNTTIIGTQDTNTSNLGNLGEEYAFPFTQIALLDRASSKVSFVQLQDTFAQYITLLPGNYFKTVLGIEAKAQAPVVPPKPTFVDLYSTQNETKTNQQLYTFIVKYDLEKTRLKQQSTPLVGLTLVSGVPGMDNDDAPTCEDLAVQQCTQQGLSQSDGETYESCVKTNKNQNKTQKTSGLCSDSPLYLYGPAGLLVDVQIQTPLFNAIPAYKNGYQVTLADNGKMKINDKEYTRITYDYTNNAKRVSPPKKGAYVTKDNAGKVVKEYAAKLGLNEKETSDLIAASREKITADYAFISFFDQEMSEQILPIAFSPKPDNYLNVVFYFKNLDVLPNFTPAQPVFPEPVKRTGFTAVEVSEIVE